MSYIFKCKKCQTEFEIVANFITITTIHPNCPSCYSKEVSRKYTPLNIIFNGKGFYKTDNG